MPKAAKTPVAPGISPRDPGPSPVPDAAADPVAGLIARWPPGAPLAVLHSADPASPHSRWSLIASPAKTTRTPRGSSETLLPTPRAPRAAVPIDPELLRSSRPRAGLVPPPFTTGHLGYLSYDASLLLEPTAHHSTRPTNDRAWPLAHWLRIDDALIYDHAFDQWWGLGDAAALLSTLSPQHLITSHHLTPPVSTTGRARFLSQVRAALDYIRAGDIYQVNLAHRLTSTFEGSPRSLFLSLMRSARPWYGAYLEFKDTDGRDRIIASASPELFLDFDPASRRITTRPMKGTRRGDADPRELLASTKDQAELNMITDLMRNDLGRICDFGSVRVESARDLERHGSSAPSSPHHVITSSPGILQTTSTIRGTVRPSLAPADILAATFPGGSITGAPKIRAMQIIDELEPVARGPYCGCIGFLGDDSRLSLSIAIRTALLTRAKGQTALRQTLAPQTFTLDYSVGAGIVADSDPESEWAETLAKAAVLDGVRR